MESCPTWCLNLPQLRRAHLRSRSVSPQRRPFCPVSLRSFSIGPSRSLLHNPPWKWAIPYLKRLLKHRCSSLCVGLFTGMCHGTLRLHPPELPCPVDECSRRMYPLMVVVPICYSLSAVGLCGRLCLRPEVNLLYGIHFFLTRLEPTRSFCGIYTPTKFRHPISWAPLGIPTRQIL